MELVELGFSDWFQTKQEEVGRPGQKLARVTAVNRDNYLLKNESGEVLAELSGKLMFSAESPVDLPAVGDWVFVEYYNTGTFAIIDGMLPRKSVLRRKMAGKRVEYQMIAVNIDVALIMQSCDANFNLRRLERYLVMASDGGIEPLLLLSKTDLISSEALAEKIASIKSTNTTCEVVAFSNETGMGMRQIERILEPGKTFCLLGSSGVGKTTLLNRLVGRDAFEINAVRTKDGKGRHTTTRRQLVMLEGGAMLIDTPGMRELGTIGVEAGIDESFADIVALSEGCRFGDCTHVNEEGCSVLQAVESGDISQARYQSYLKLRNESEYHELSYAEKRKKDRKLGQFYKSAKKDLKKR